jgi:hypothetical protein
MLNKEAIKLKKLHLQYADIHYFLSELANDFAELEERRSNLSSQLDRLREDEKIIINNLEAELGREVTPQELYEIIKKSNEEIENLTI